jgi:hypothetical protein
VLLGTTYQCPSTTTAGKEPGQACNFGHQLRKTIANISHQPLLDLEKREAEPIEALQLRGATHEFSPTATQKKQMNTNFIFT